jgi:hypothetical protein
MSELTQREILNSIKEGQEAMAKVHLEFSLSVSTFMNKQNELNTKVLGYLQNDNETNTKGIVELANDNKNRLDDFDSKDKVRMGKISALSLVFGFIGSILIKMFLK